MTPKQADNLRILIRHAETNMTRTLNMDQIESSCGTPACMLGEAICVLKMPKIVKAYEAMMGGVRESIWPAVNREFSCRTESRLFGMGRDNAWNKSDVTPAEWATEARKVLAENGYTMPPKDDGFAAFKVKMLAPVALDNAIA